MYEKIFALMIGFIFVFSTPILGEDCSSSLSGFAEERVKAADADGLILNTFKHSDFSESISRYDMACLALQAVMLKNKTDLFSYMRINNISLNYGKYSDVFSPRVLLAEELGLVFPYEGKYFNPDSAVTRQETAYTLNRLCELLGVETTPRETVFYDDGDIDERAREAVYNVSGTSADDTFILAQAGANSFMPDSTDYSLERAVMAVWRIYNFENTDFSAYETKFDKVSIGCGLYAYRNTDGKWGVYGDGFSVPPFYELPCESGSFEAFDDTFTLALTDSEACIRDGFENTYYVFTKSEGLIKTFEYSLSDIQAEKPGGYVFTEVKPVLAYGSNLVLNGSAYEAEGDGSDSEKNFIKRLVSENIGFGGTNIEIYKDGMLKGTEVFEKKYTSDCRLKEGDVISFNCRFTVEAPLISSNLTDWELSDTLTFRVNETEVKADYSIICGSGGNISYIMNGQNSPDGTCSASAEFTVSGELAGEKLYVYALFNKAAFFITACGIPAVREPTMSYI
ncbi:MAG: S-layer homology domain-containing protein [Clostridiales bacterium]|nr:S-layer homology domain-containing protein [Clostridiales bacterium]